MEDKSAWRQLVEMPLVPRLFYILCFPVGSAFLVGWNAAPEPGLSYHLIWAGYWLGFIILGWWSIVASIVLGHMLLRPWQPPLWLLSVLPPLAIGWVAWFPMAFYVNGLNPLLPSPEQNIDMMTFALNSTFFLQYMQLMTPFILLTVILNYYYNRVLGVACFVYPSHPVDVLTEESTPEQPLTEMPAVSTPVPLPAFVLEMREELRGDPLAIQAQEHFIRIWTEAGSDLVNYSFGKAVKASAAVPGMQVHRSYWVADAAVATMEKEGAKYFIRLHNDERFPVSQSYLNAARERYLT